MVSMVRLAPNTPDRGSKGIKQIRSRGQMTHLHPFTIYLPPSGSDLPLLGRDLVEAAMINNSTNDGCWMVTTLNGDDSSHLPEKKKQLAKT